jgi:hypothetical protein
MRLSRQNMTDCYLCKRMIRGKPFRRDEETGHTVRADGKQDKHYKKVSICKRCVNLSITHNFDHSG